MTWISWGFVVVVMQVAVWATPATAPAERKDSYADKIEQEKKTLEKLRGTIVEKRKKADEAEKNASRCCRGSSRWTSASSAIGRSIKTFEKSSRRRTWKSST